MKLTYFGQVESGQLKLSNRKQFDKDLTQYEGKRVQIELSRAVKKRSTSQNAYYWAVVIPIAKQGLEDAGNQGLTDDLVHDFFKAKYLERIRDIVIPKTGEVFQAKTTTDLTTTEMMTYIESIAQFCAEFLNVIIPEPKC